MSGFDGSYKVDVFDTLTVTVMIEQCEPELTIVTWWEIERRGDPPHKYTSCLACLLKNVARVAMEDGRASLLWLVKEGYIQIESIKPIVSDVWRCPRCRAHLKDIPNESWLSNLQS